MKGRRSGEGEPEMESAWETTRKRRSGEVKPESVMAWEATKECRSGKVESPRRGM